MYVFGALCVYDIDLFYHSYSTVMPQDALFYIKTRLKVSKHDCVFHLDVCSSCSQRMCKLG